jgi:hypothetical protein
LCARAGDGDTKDESKDSRMPNCEHGIPLQGGEVSKV